MRISQADPVERSIDPESWVDAHGDYLFRYAKSRLQDVGAAEEVVQEVFLAAVRNCSSIREAAATRGWLMAILRTKIVDYIRQRRRKADSWGDEPDPTALLFDAQGRWRPSALPAIQPDRNLYSEDLWQVVKTCLDSLPQGQADVFVLSVMEEMASDEVCDHLDIQPSTMWTRLHRARLALARCVAAKGFGILENND